MNDALFLSKLLHYIHSCFTEEELAGLSRDAVPNAEMYKCVLANSILRGDRALFDQLAAQSASLSVSDSSLYDIHGGSGVPSDATSTGNMPYTPHALPLVPLSDACLASVRADTLSM